MQKVKLAGLDTELDVTPMSYTAWEDLEDTRMAAMEETVELEEAGKKDRASLVIHKMMRELREAKMAHCVVGWEGVKKTLTKAQALELETIVDKLNRPEIERGNSSAGAAGGTTPAA
jgi:hypothetical protein